VPTKLSTNTDVLDDPIDQVFNAEEMSAHIERTYLVGYQVTRADVSENSIAGKAEINGLQVEHNLSICVQGKTATDVGRNSDGELVWISINETSEHISPTMLGQTLEKELFLLPRNFEPVAIEVDASVNEHVPLRDANLTAKFTARVSHKRVLFSLGLVSLLVVFGLFLIPGKQATIENISSNVTNTPSADVVIQEPTQAAIDFVLGGSLTQLKIPNDVTAEELQATVVSQSGEVVLVEVSLLTNEDLTTFATLLLQKSGATWRIREVFDSQ